MIDWRIDGPFPLFARNIAICATYLGHIASTSDCLISLAHSSSYSTQQGRVLDINSIAHPIIPIIMLRSSSRSLTPRAAWPNATHSIPILLCNYLALETKHLQSTPTHRVSQAMSKIQSKNECVQPPTEIPSHGLIQSDPFHPQFAPAVEAAFSFYTTLGNLHLSASCHFEFG